MVQLRSYSAKRFRPDDLLHDLGIDFLAVMRPQFGEYGLVEGMLMPVYASSSSGLCQDELWLFAANPAL